MLYLALDLTYTVLAALPKFLFLIFLPTILVFIHEVIFFPLVIQCVCTSVHL